MQYVKLDFDGLAKYSDEIVTDMDVAKHVIKHMRLRDMLSVKKVVVATLNSFAILSPPKEEMINDDNWKYKF